MPASWFSQTEMGINSGWVFKSLKHLIGTAEQGNVRPCPFPGALNKKRRSGHPLCPPGPPKLCPLSAQPAVGVNARTRVDSFH